MRIMPLLIPIALSLITACGDDGDVQTSASLEMPDDAAESAPEETANMDAVIDSSTEQCRTQMRAIADAQEIYFAERGNYSDPWGLSSSGILPEACEFRCPESGASYTTTLAGSDLTSYRLQCESLSGESGHGYLQNGDASWE